MNFKELQDQVIAGSFDESLRGQVKTWLNNRYQMLWALDDWTFKDAAVNVGTLAGSNLLQNLPPDVGMIYSITNQDGEELLAIPDPREYYRTYVSATSPQVGPPEAYSAVNEQILLGPIADTTRDDYTLLYRKAVTLLDDDTDIPAFPAGFHLALVHGAKADGYTMRAMILFAGVSEQMFGEVVDAMREELLGIIVDAGDWWSGRYRPEAW